jgi:hypothetical protein
VDVQQRPAEEALMVRFLLGQLSPGECDAIEERFLREPRYFEEFLAFEEALIDDYVRGALSDDQRQRFERHWLISQERRERVEMATGLRNIFRREIRGKRLAGGIPRVLAQRGRPVRLRLAFAATAVVATLGALWLVRETARSRSELAQLQEQRAGLQQEQEELRRQLAGERARSSELEAQLRTETGQSANDGAPAVPGPIVAFSLSAPLTRSEGSQDRLQIPSAAGAVRLEVVVPTVNHTRYRGVVRTPEGSEFWIQDMLPGPAPPADARVQVTVPAAVLPDGDYILTVKGFKPDGNIEDITSRTFRIVRK